ncbi:MULTISPECIES: hypothetical protein [unclassified Meiothermus]|uniref:hypothetical protein n=1 Tax=unclassified Meiothermus TaxID=370471 RepID=UPI000D7BBDB2|nr:MULTISPECIES: hypothetical protein [unclassified Meiothermus]PZA07979.1 hypothetical protein DNA98_06710 [Meiothermus sp. Pnk-1]RYM35336.1 hypothetical protein EWH23_11585 [Meiothermus sp. PNK-Is4]
MKRLFVVPLLGLLAACTALPFSTSIKDYDTKVALVGTSTVVLQRAQLDQRPGVALKSIEIVGNVTYQQQDVTLEFYAADQPPCGTAFSGVYTCPANSPNLESIGQVNFSSGATQPFTWQGSELTSGVNKGELYLGVRLKSGQLAGGTLQFRNMVAKVAVF